MMESPGENMHKKFGRLSLSIESIPSVEIAVHLLDQVFEYLKDEENNTAFLKAEGIYRQSGSEKEIRACYDKIKRNPIGALLKNFPEIINNPHNVVGVLKKSLFDVRIVWSKKALKTLQQFQLSFQMQSESKSENIDNANITTSSDTVAKLDPSLITQLINDLRKDGAVTEAKLIHNLLHLCFLISQHEKVNKMTPDNMAIVMAPSLSAMTNHQFPVDKNLYMFQSMNRTITTLQVDITSKVYNLMVDAIASETCFGLPFEKMYTDPLPPPLKEEETPSVLKEEETESVETQKLISKPKKQSSFKFPLSFKKQNPKNSLLIEPTQPLNDISRRRLQTKSVSLMNTRDYQSYIREGILPQKISEETLFQKGTLSPETTKKTLLQERSLPQTTLPPEGTKSEEGEVTKIKRSPSFTLSYNQKKTERPPAAPAQLETKPQEEGRSENKENSAPKKKAKWKLFGQKQ